MTEATWSIEKTRAVVAPSGSLLNAAYDVRLTCDASTRSLVVEFADASTVASNGYAEEVARRYVRDVEPPRHLVVDSSGTVTVVVGPLTPGVDTEDRGPASVRARRARSHRRHTG